MKQRHRTAGVWFLTLLLAVLALFTTIHETGRWRKAPFGDFNYLQTGGECLIAGCDPYDSDALNRQAQIRHEPKPAIWPMTPVYPPSTLLLLLPFAGAGWPLAAYLFNALAGFATALVCALLPYRKRMPFWHPAAIPLLALTVCLPMASTLEFANPALLTAALTTLACLLLLETSLQAPGWILLGLSLALKPQLAAAAAATLLWRPETRTAAAKACGLAVALLLLGSAAYGIRLGSFHYLATLRWVLWLSALPGGSSDYANNESFDFLNLQTAFALLPHASRGLINALAWTCTFLLAAATLLRSRAREMLRQRPWTILALFTAISMLPVYHRGYDRVIALLLVPAIGEMFERSRLLAWLYAPLLTLWIANDTIMTHILKRWHFKPQNPVEDVLFCLVLLASLRSSPGRVRPAFEEAELVAS